MQNQHARQRIAAIRTSDGNAHTHPVLRGIARGHEKRFVQRALHHTRMNDRRQQRRRPGNQTAVRVVQIKCHTRRARVLFEQRHRGRSAACSSAPGPAGGHRPARDPAWARAAANSSSGVARPRGRRVSLPTTDRFNSASERIFVEREIRNFMERVPQFLPTSVRRFRTGAGPSARGAGFKSM